MDASSVMSGIRHRPGSAVAAIKMERRFAFAVAVVVMALTCLPYVYGYRASGTRPELGVYSWSTFYMTDDWVYLSWLRQARDGHLFQLNLFTTEPQVGHQFNLFFLALGNVARLAGLPVGLSY